MFLLDTDVISRTSPYSRHAGDVHGWLAEHKDRSYLSVVTFSELWRGAYRLHARGSLRKAHHLEAWIAAVESSVAGRVLPVDSPIGRRTGILVARAEAAGHQPSFVDACLAATAAERDFTVITFNTRHFVAFGVPHRKPLADDHP